MRAAVHLGTLRLPWLRRMGDQTSRQERGGTDQSEVRAAQRQRDLVRKRSVRFFKNENGV